MDVNRELVSTLVYFPSSIIVYKIPLQYGPMKIIFTMLKLSRDGWYMSVSHQNPGDKTGTLYPAEAALKRVLTSFKW